MFNNIYKKSNITNYRNNLGDNRRVRVKTSLNSNTSRRQLKVII